jgi:hypothetical protein
VLAVHISAAGGQLYEVTLWQNLVKDTAEAADSRVLWISLSESQCRCTESGPAWPPRNFLVRRGSFGPGSGSPG